HHSKAKIELLPLILCSYNHFFEAWPKGPNVIKYLIEITNILSGSNGNPDEDTANARACYNISENDETCLPNQHTLEHKIDDDEETKSETSSPDFEDLLEMDVSSDTSDEFSEHDIMEEDNMEVDETRFEYDDLMPETGITPNIIACLLVMFKRRHRLPMQYISDLLKLLSILGVDSAPRSWHMLKRLITKTDATPSYHYSCFSCFATSTSRKCSNCGYSFSSNIFRDYFLTLSVKHQLDIILNNNVGIDLFSSSSDNHISDIKDGNFYRQLSNICPDKFITLTMNVDGVEVKKGSKQSIWSMLLVVNELPINRRNAFENVIIVGVWSGSHNPSREQMQCFLAPVVEQLSLLERRYPFSIIEIQNVYRILLSKYF
ncbi:unnamed protein product, partial [Rotaria magnacalcarata]